MANDAIAEVQPLVDQAGAFASSAGTSATTATAAANSAQAQATVALGGASTAQSAAIDAASARDLALGYSNAAATSAEDAFNDANDAAGAVAKASDYAVLTQAWAEYMPGTIPPNILAVADVTGDHWSARWWANQAAGAFGMLKALYMGALPGAPGSTPTGDPIPVGAIYYNTTTLQPYVWTGTSWQPFTSPAKAVIIGLIYAASAGQTVFSTGTLDLSGHSYTVTTEPLEIFVNGVRIPQSRGGFTGDWDNAGSVITFNTPLLAGSMVTVNVLTPDTSSGTLPGGPYLALAGGTMTGPLLLAGDGTGALQPVTRQQLDLKVNRAGDTLTGDLILRGNPTTANMAANKAYADTMVRKIGDAMTGGLVLFGPPTAPLMAATKAYVDAGDGTRLPLAGGTLTGDLVLRGSPTTNNMAATKFYVDQGIASVLPFTGGTLTGDLILNGPPTSVNMAANKGYVDARLPLAGGAMTGMITFPVNFGLTWPSASFYEDNATNFVMTGPASRMFLGSDGSVHFDRGSPGFANLGSFDPSGNFAAAGTVTGAGVRSTTSMSLVNTGAYWSSDANGTYFAFDSGNWRWNYQRSTGQLDYLRGYDGASLFSIGPGGTVNVAGALGVGSSITSNANIVMNQAGVGSNWAADGSNVYFTFAAGWGWLWQRTTGNLFYSRGSDGAQLLEISAAGAGIACPSLGGAYANFSAIGWDGQSVQHAGGGGFTGWLIRSATDTGAGYQGVYKQNIAPGGASMYAWYSGSSAVGWACGAVSDRRLKSNIVPAGDALAALLQIPIYACDITIPSFQARHADFALIADESHAVIPTSVLEKPDDPDLYDAPDQLVLICALIKGVQQLAERVTALEARP